MKIIGRRSEVLPQQSAAGEDVIIRGKRLNLS